MTRRFITTLLILMLTLSGTIRALASPRDDDDKKITTEEEYEARELVEGFNAKFNETNDIAPLIKEYFVPDFASRLREHAETFPFTLIEWKDETAPPDPDDLQRLYVGSTNFLHMLFPLYAAAATHRRDKENEDKEPRLGEVLPPAAVELMKSDPWLRYLGLDSDEESRQKASDESGQPKTNDVEGNGTNVGNCAMSDDDKADFIKNAEELRQLADHFESLSKILREHLATHPILFDKEETGARDESDEGTDEVKFDPNKIDVFHNARILRKEFYGYPEGTRLICANAGSLHVEMVRVDGRLRILSVYLLIDD